MQLEPLLQYFFLFGFLEDEKRSTFLRQAYDHFLLQSLDLIIHQTYHLALKNFSQP